MVTIKTLLCLHFVDYKLQAKELQTFLDLSLLYGDLRPEGSLCLKDFFNKIRNKDYNHHRDQGC